MIVRFVVSLQWKTLDLLSWYHFLSLFGLKNKQCKFQCFQSFKVSREFSRESFLSHGQSIDDWSSQWWSKESCNRANTTCKAFFELGYSPSIRKNVPKKWPVCPHFSGGSTLFFQIPKPPRRRVMRIRDANLCALRQQPKIRFLVNVSD